MSKDSLEGYFPGKLSFESGNVARYAARFLSLAAAPSFGIMALLTGVLGWAHSDLLCSVPHGASPLTGMVPMYLLMSVFHSTPWLRREMETVASAQPGFYNGPQTEQLADRPGKMIKEVSP